MNTYLNDIARDFCPFLRLSLDRGFCSFSLYEISNYTMLDAQEFLFCTGLVHTQRLRAMRRVIGKQSHLWCENVVLTTSDEVTVDGKELFSWPHWCLKSLYSKSSVVCGKFWIGETGLDKNGRQIPEPVSHFLSIRSAIKEMDGRFFQKATELRNDFEQGEDVGDDPLTEILERKQHRDVHDILTRPTEDDADVKSKIADLMTINVYADVVRAIRQRHDRF